jgi:hypothetical protein
LELKKKPSKPSFNGVHANLFIFYEDSILCGGSEKLYTDVVNADKNCVDGGQNKHAKLAI